MPFGAGTNGLPPPDVGRHDLNDMLQEEERRLKEELDKRRADLGYRTAAFVVNYSLPACVRACVPACLPRDSCPHTRPILSAAGLCHSN